MALDTIEAAIQDFQDGKMVIVIDEEDRENEGDLTMAAEKVTPEDINFHGQIRPRAHLHADDVRAAAGAECSVDGIQE